MNKQEKLIPHWMDCNCKCHNFNDNTGESCPHCKPELYPEYVVQDEGYCLDPVHYLPNDIICKKWHMKLSDWKKVKSNYEN